MKVDIVQEMLKAGYTSSVQNKEKPNEKGFGKILEDTLNTSSDTKTEGSTMPVPGLGGMGDIQAVPSPIDMETPVYENTHRLLDALDEYRGMLADHQVPAEELQPMVDKLSDQSARLSADLTSLPEGSPLKDIVNQALIVSSLEVVKFGRGDYGTT